MRHLTQFHAQVDADAVQIAASWQPVLRGIVAKVAKGLGIQEDDAKQVDARLYKLLLYEQVCGRG